MSNMKITFVLSSLTLSGGVNVVIEYANRLSVDGYDVTLVVPGGMIDAAQRSKLHSAVSVRESRRKLSPKHSLVALALLSFSIAQTIPRSDVVIATHTPTVVPVALASLIFKKGKRTWLFQDYTEMFINRPMERMLLKMAPKWFARIAVVSKACKDTLLLEANSKSIFVGEGLSHSELLFDSGEKETKNNTIDIMYVGDMRPRKGLRDFLDATEIVYQEFSNIKLIIVSKELCDIQTNVPHEFFLYPSYEELAKLYRQSYIFVSTSWAEGLGLPPLEAMASGTPVVLTNSQGALDYALPEENCIMVSPHVPKEVAAAIKRLLLDEKLWMKLRENGRKTAQRYDWDEAVARFKKFLYQV